MTRRKVLLTILLLLLSSTGIAGAQSSQSFVAQRAVMTGGAMAGSANYTVIAVIGQPAVDVVGSDNYRVSGGFLWSRRAGSLSEEEIELWLPLIVK